jgi:hypothetical protein
MSGLLGLLRDTAQGASNAAAGVVAGPVDLINMGLLAAGLPMPAAPVGGSQWMRDRGLMRQPGNFQAGLLGETIGNVLPIVTAARAPQIAAGLLQAGENLRAPTPMNTATRNQAGAIVFHGSPHKFDKFDSSRIGTGEGAQAYGHGLYFADAKDVARSYRDKLTTGISAGADGQAAYLLKMYKTPEKALEAARSQITPNLTGDARKFADDVIRVLENGSPNMGALYKVDLPDEAIARMLDWDKPWSQQPESVRKAVDVSALEKFYNTKDLATSQVLYHLNQGRPPAQTAEFLRSRGVPGVRYLDGGSRSAGGGTSNYVVFPGEEGVLTILGRE